MQQANQQQTGPQQADPQLTNQQQANQQQTDPQQAHPPPAHPDLPSVRQLDIQRMNFFTGFMTTAQDWCEGQAYYIEKDRRPLRSLYTPGVIQGLQVVPALQGGRQIQVEPGAALDSLGNLIEVRRSIPLELPAPQPGASPFAAGARLYVALAYDEQTAQPITIVDEPGHSGDTRIAELAIVRLVALEPSDPHLSLACITLPAADAALSAGQIDNGCRRIAAPRQDRLQALYDEQAAQQRRLNQSLHSPGVLAGIDGNLAVHAAGDYRVRVAPGAALDDQGRELRLVHEAIYALDLPSDPLAPRPAQIYVAVEALAAAPQSTALLSMAPQSTARVVLSPLEPDNRRQIELARIPLATLHAPFDDAQIDTSRVVYARSRRPDRSHLTPAQQQRVAGVLQATRTHFAALDAAYPVPALVDVRSAALHGEMAVGGLEPQQLAGVWHALDAVQQSSVRGLLARYARLGRTVEYAELRDAAQALHDSLASHTPVDDRLLDVLLHMQETVAQKAHLLAQRQFLQPTAHAGDDQTAVVDASGFAIVTLDASRSRDAQGRPPVEYRWEKVL